MTWNDVIMQLVMYMVPAVGALFMALLGYLVSFLSKHQKKIRNEILRDSFGAALGEAHIVARDAILYAQQTLVDALKEASMDGKLTKEEALQAMNEAKAYFITHISENSKNILIEALGPINNWLSSFLEARLREYKGEVQNEVYGLANPFSPGITE